MTTNITNITTIGTTFGSEADSHRFPIVLPAECEQFTLNLGLGVDSVAMLAGLYLAGQRPQQVIVAMLANEWPETMAYYADVLKPWLATWGVEVIEVTRATSGIKVDRIEDLGEECLRSRTLPSKAYMGDKCSSKHKAEAIFRYQRGTQLLKDENAAGRRVAKMIGYECEETSRFLKKNNRKDQADVVTLHGRAAYGESYYFDFFGGKEGEAMVPMYPLVDWQLNRVDCIALITHVLGSAPRKSACVFCPMNNDDDFNQLAALHPTLWTLTLAIEANAWMNVDSQTNTGLRKRGPTGKLTSIDHAWKKSIIAYAKVNGLHVDPRVDALFSIRTLEVLAFSQDRMTDADNLRAEARDIVASIMVDAYPAKYADHAAALAKLEDAPASQLDPSKIKQAALEIIWSAATL